MKFKYLLSCFVKLIYSSEEDYTSGELVMINILVTVAVFAASITL